jgi:hypothetical protein
MLLLAAIIIPPAADCFAYFLGKRGLITTLAFYILLFGGICSGSVLVAQLFESRFRPAAAIGFAGIAFYFTWMAWLYIAWYYFGVGL